MPEAQEIKEFLEKNHLVYGHEGSKLLSQRGRRVLQTLQSIALMEVVFDAGSPE